MAGRSRRVPERRTGLARLGAVVIALGLLFALAQMLGARIPVRLGIVLARFSIVAGALCVAFLVTWSLQPGFWQEVGSQGPATLAAFSSLTAFQLGAVSMARKHALIRFSPQEILAARESTVAPSLELTVQIASVLRTDRSGRATLSRSTRLSSRTWVGEKTQVHSLWVSVLLGRRLEFPVGGSRRCAYAGRAGPLGRTDAGEYGPIPSVGSLRTTTSSAARSGRSPGS